MSKSELAAAMSSLHGPSAPDEPDPLTDDVLILQEEYRRSRKQIDLLEARVAECHRTIRGLYSFIVNLMIERSWRERL